MRVAARALLILIGSAGSALLASAPAFAYPILMKCDARGGLSQRLGVAEIQGLFSSPGHAPGPELAHGLELSRGLSECTDRYRQQALLAGINPAAASRLLEKHTDAQLREAGLGASDLSAVAMLLRLQACRASMSRLPAERYLTGKEKDRLVVYYPWYSNFMYATGCPALGAGCDLPVAKAYEKAIEGALLMGADPYVALALGTMEGGANGVAKLYLDPIAKYGAMGCSGRVIGQGSKGQGAEKQVFSYETRFEIQAGTISNAALSRRLEGWVRAARNDWVRPGKSYFCRDRESQHGELSREPRAGHCCLELDFEVETSAGVIDPPWAEGELEQALIFDFIRGCEMRPYPRAQARGQDSPAWRLQRFNGFSPLYGRSELLGNGIFRGGVDYTSEPGYGHQAIDLVLNAYLVNPAIQRLVMSKSAELGVPVPSVFCRGRSGVFVIDSDTGFKSYRDQKRLATIASKQPPRWEALSRAEKLVLAMELSDRPVSREIALRFGGAVAASINEDRRRPIPPQLGQRLLEFYLAELYRGRDTVSKASGFPEPEAPWRRFSDAEVGRLGERLRRAEAADGAAGREIPPLQLKLQLN